MNKTRRQGDVGSLTTITEGIGPWVASVRMVLQAGAWANCREKGGSQAQCLPEALPSRDMDTTR